MVYDLCTLVSVSFLDLALILNTHHYDDLVGTTCVDHKGDFRKQGSRHLVKQQCTRGLAGNIDHIEQLS